MRIQTTTTHLAQIELLKKSVEEYGETKKYYYESKYRCPEWFIYVDLHHSFDFLIKKLEKIPDWILENDGYFYNFLAAYTDCEVHWNMNKSHEKHFRYVFRLRTGDKKMLEQIKDRLESEGIFSLFTLIKMKEGKTAFPKFNLDMYELTINRKKDTIYLINRLLKFSKHSEKIRKMNFILENRNKTWSKVKPLLEKLRKEIKKEILK